MIAPVFIRYPKGGEDKAFNRKLRDSDNLNTENNLDYIYIKNKKSSELKFLIVSYGRISKIAFEVYARLNNNNINAGFLKLNKIKPADYIFPEIKNSKAENIIFIEEGIECGGISEYISSHLKKVNCGKKTKIFAVNNFIEQGTTEQLFELCGFNSEKIYKNIIEM